MLELKMKTKKITVEIGMKNCIFYFLLITCLTPQALGQERDDIKNIETLCLEVKEIYPDIGEAVKRTVSLEATFQPNTENHQKYRELYGLYKELYQHVWDDWDMRTAILNQMSPQTEQ